MNMYYIHYVYCLTLQIVHDNVCIVLYGQVKCVHILHDLSVAL